MTANDFLKIWLKIIGISSIFILIFSFIISLSPFLDADGSEMILHSYSYIVFSVYAIVLNTVILIPTLLIIMYKVNTCENSVITSLNDFENTKTAYKLLMAITFVIILVEIPLVGAFLLMCLNTIIGLVLFNNSWKKYQQ